MSYVALHRTRLLVLLVCTIAAPAAGAVTFASFTPLPPLAPILEQPGATATVMSAQPNGGTTLVFQWRHGGLFSSYPRPASPTHFVVCLGDAASVASCDYPGQWAAPVGQIPSALAGTWPPGSASPGQYRYWYTVPALDDGYLDRLLSYRVGACSAPQAGRCTFSDARAFVLSTKELTATNVSFGGTTSTTLATKAYARNAGATDTSGFMISMEWFAALQDVISKTAQCIKDPNHALVQLTDVVISTTGRMTLVQQLPLDASGLRLAPKEGVAGIYRPGGAASAALAQFTGTLAPGQERIVADLPLYVPMSAGRPISFVARATIDVHAHVFETNENDNVAADCRSIQP